MNGRNIKKMRREIEGKIGKAADALFGEGTAKKFVDSRRKPNGPPTALASASEAASEGEGQAATVAAVVSPADDKETKDQKAEVKVRANEYLLDAIATKQSTAVVSGLLGLKADVNCISREGQRPLEAAVGNQLAEVANILLEAKANVNSQNSLTGETPLHHAVVMNKEGSSEIVKNLLAAKADVTIQTYGGESVLQYAAKSPNPYIKSLFHSLYSPSAPAASADPAADPVSSPSIRPGSGPAG